MKSIVANKAGSAIKLRNTESVWQWAERNVSLSVRTTATPGKYNSAWIPYVRGWQEAWTDPYIRQIIICAGGQTGKTESVLNCLRYSIAEDPGPMLYIMPAAELARSFSETRLQPSLRDCGPCADQIPDDPDRFKLLEMHLRDCTLNLIGANSPAQISSRPIRYLFTDEIDKYPEASNKEAGALELAQVRIATFWNSKTILTSTPTVEAGQIWQAYLSGTQSKYLVPCPFCGEAQELVWPQIKWPKNEATRQDHRWIPAGVESSAKYECAYCTRQIESRQKAAMLRKGYWHPSNTSAPRDRVSFHLSALYSPFRSFGSIAREFVEQKDSISGLQNFTNSVLAEPWKVLGEEVSEASLIELRQEYQLGTCPTKPLYLIPTVDVQRDCIYYVIRAWSKNRESWLIDYGKLPSLGDLIGLVRQSFPVAGTAERVTCDRGMVDSGYSTQEVYEFCSDSKIFMPAKGWGGRQAEPVKDREITFMPGRIKIERKLRLFNYDDNVFKTELYIRRIQDHDGPAWHLAQNTGQDYIAQLTRERLVERKNKRGIIERVWHVTHRDNHYGDCEKLQLVCEYLVARRLRLL